MRFLSFNLERYGHFTGRELSFRAGAPLHIVHGANEAGKSTALAAITDLLFGYETRISFDFQHLGTSLRLGASVQLADGSTRTFRRRRGTKISLVDAGEQPLGEDYLDDIVGSLSREQFRAEFGLATQDLISGGKALLATRGRLAEMLATGSAGLSALLQLEKSMAAEADELFSDRRTASKPFYRAVDEYVANEKDLGKAIVKKEEWAAAHTLLAQRQAATLEMERALKALEAHKAQLVRVASLGPVLLRLDVCRAVLQGLAHLPDIPPTHRQNWASNARDHAEITRQLADLAGDQRNDAQRLATLQRNPRLLATSEELKHLQGDLGAVKLAETDMPNRQEARREAQARLEDLALRLRLADVGDLLRNQPSETELVAIRGHVGAAKQADNALHLARRATHDRRAALEQLQASGRLPAHLIDPAPLHQRLESFAEIPRECESARRETAYIAAKSTDIAAAIARLHPGTTGIFALRQLALPDLPQLEVARSRQDALQRETDELEARRKATNMRLETANAKLAGMGAKAEQVSMGALAQARAARNSALDALAAALDTTGPEKHARLATVQTLGERADDVADRLIRHSAEAARHQSAKAELAAAQAELESMDADALALGQTAAGFEQAWRQLWAPARLQPQDPRTMVQWLQSVREILAQDHELSERRASQAAMIAGLEEKRPHLHALAAALQITLAPDMPLDLVHTQARLALQALTQAWSQAREAAATRKALENNLAEAERHQIARQQLADSLLPALQQSLARLGLAPDCGFEAAETALDLWQKVEGWREKLADAQHRITGMQDRAQQFQDKVSALVAQISPNLKGMGARQALETLVQQLGEGQRAEGDWQGLTKTMHDREIKIADLSLRQTANHQVITNAQSILPAGMDLAQALEALELRTVALAEREDYLAHVRRAAGGRSEADVRAELAELGGPAALDQMESLKLAVDAKSGTAGQDYKKTVEDETIARQACEALYKGRRAPELQHALTESAADLQRIARAWLLRQSAARLARAAIEKHRAQAQHPVVARASTLFSTITGGAFTGLVADFDQKENSTLKGQRVNGQRIGMEEMSEGTRDQLFLVLRLALLEQRSIHQLPFVGDDLLTSFDEVRAAAMLEVLAQFGQRQQVILFTHHTHVVELAHARLGASVDVLHL